MFVKLPIVTAILSFIAFSINTVSISAAENTIGCDKSPLQAVFLFDISPTNSTYFAKQQQRVIETIKHIDALTQERSISFGFVVFHRLPVLLSPLNSPKSSDSSKVKEQVESVRPRRHAEASPAKALDLAAEQIEKNGREGARSIVFLVHDGLSSDLIAETLEAVDRLREQNVLVFAITGSPNPNLLALSGYTHERNRIYAFEADRIGYFAAIDDIIGYCGGELERESVPKISNSLDSNPTTKDLSAFFKFDETVACDGNERVDLMIVLDTSGSVFNAFAEERKLAQNLVKSLEPKKFEKNMQVGLVSFASEPNILLPLRHGRTPESVLNRIGEIEFTGKNTRIADAVEMALLEFDSRKRNDSAQIFILISDGHGQEYWSQAQSAGRKLQQSNAQIFVATTSTDYNLPEMILYAGDESRVFVGGQVSTFIPKISQFINKCVGEHNFNGTFENSKIIFKADDSSDKAAINLGTQSSEKASSGKNLKNSEEEKRVSSEEVSSKEKSDLKARADQLRKFLNGQESLPKSSDCNTDIVFVVERTQRSTFDFVQQLEFADNIIKGIDSGDIESGKIRFSLITFSKKPRVVASLPTKQTLNEFSAKLSAVFPSHSSPSIERGINATIEEIEANRRPDARVVVIFVASGKLDPQEKNAFEESLAKFKTINNTDTFALSLNPFINIQNLEKITGDKWRVFTDGRVRQFPREVIASIVSCSLASRESQKQIGILHEADNSVEKIEHLTQIAKSLQRRDPFCGNENIDFVVIFDISTSIAADFDKQKQAVLNLVKQAPVADFGKRIKFGLTTFNQHAKTLISLNNSLSKDDVLFAIDRIEHIGGQTSAVTGIGQSLADIQQFRRADGKLKILILSDGNSKDAWSRVMKAGNSLRKSNAEVYAIALSKEKSIEELAVYTDSTKKVFTEDKIDLFTLSAQKVLFECSKDLINPKLSDITVAEQVSGEIENIEALDKIATLPKRPKPTTTTIHPPLTTTGTIETSTARPEYSLATPPSSEKEKHIPTLFSEDCSVDLMFIIDTSTSVTNEFQKQLQFAVDLVKRLPDDDFENRVNVAAVSFFREAKVEFPFGAMREKTQILDGLFGIMHTGGSTSAVSGVKLAVDEIIRGRRKGARLMTVLISDGNSQDPWQEVVDAAKSLRDVNADVYAVTVSHDYFFRELELYAGNKWFVYIDARIRQFLDEAEMSVVECRNPSIPASDKDPAAIGPKTKIEDFATTLSTLSSSIVPFPIPSSFKSTCQQDIVDLLIIIDTSTSVEKEFYAEKNFALDLVKVLPESDFENRIRIALVKFDSKSKLQFTFGEKKTRNDVLYEIERAENTGGLTSVVSGVSLGLKEIASKQRNESRLVTIIISDGNSQDEWENVQTTAKQLKETGSEIYSVTLSEKYYFDELKEYTGNARHVYTDERIDEFIQDVGMSVVSCPGRVVSKVTLAPTVEISVTPTPLSKESTSTSSPTTTTTEKPEKSEDIEFEAAQPEFALAKDAAPETLEISESQGVPVSQNKRCKYSKMDVIIILDASSSRESVFEHQRELALSLIERLPVSKDGTHVATGINSFTSTPVLRQTLGLGRDKLMVRHAIEAIKYNGGSTLTSKAVELAVKDLERGKRPDALQVVVLLNDGMSQDPWDKVLMAAESLKATGAERFGVALGEDVDLRELRHYIENDTRIYRDGSTERFLSDVVSLLNGGEKDCPNQDSDDSGFEPMTSVEECSKPKLDIVIVFDATESKKDNTKVGSNKYLLLDVLGSLPANDDVKVAIFTFGPDPKLIQEFSDPQKFEIIDTIQIVDGKPSYAKAVHAGLDYYNSHKRSDARGVFLIVGDGESTDKPEERSLASNVVRKANGLECHAVHSGKEINERTLKAFTGDAKRVYNYDRNSDFAKELLRLATLGQTEQCVEARKQIPVQASSDKNQEQEQTYSTSEPFAARRQRLKDISGALANGIDTEKVVGVQKTTLRRPQTTTPISSTRKIQTTSESPTTVAASTSTAKTATTKWIRTTKRAILTEAPTTVSPSTTTTTKRLRTTKRATTATSTEATTTTVSSTTKAAQKFTTVKSSTKLPKSLKAASESADVVEKKQKSTTLKPISKTSVSTTTEVPVTKSLKEKKVKTAKTSPKTTTTEAPSTAEAVTSSLTPTPSNIPLSPTTSFPFEASTPKVPGCLIDLLIIIDSSGSVEATFNKEKELISQVIDKLRIGPNNARVSLIKFAATEKVRTIVSFDGPQSKLFLQKSLERIPFSSGTTAIHSALLHAVSEYSPLKGARPGKATPIAVIFTDGFSQRDTSKESALLRQAIPDLYAVAINHDYPISRVELEKITGDARRVFTDINDLHRVLTPKFRSC